ncbi:hypothetical protein M422DRAFT_250048 [Sphaerobolus stellatus SS14]|nr:hypothetical protein M422DRAFT_250048 [Sphaerobolus stellatus SS14]
MVITELPEDVLSDILGQLPYEDVCSCRLACRLFNALVNGTPSIQYNSELDKAGFVDTGACSDLCLVDRLKELRAVQKNWATLSFRGRYIVPEITGTIAWDLVGGILAYLCRSLDDRNGLSFIQLRSTAQDCREPRIWTHEDIGLANLRDFTIYPAQDLVVLVSMTQPTRKTDIHFLSINTGKSHPEAQQPMVWCEPDERNGYDHLVIRVFGEFAGILFGNWVGREQLFIWNWKSGVLVSFLESPEHIIFGSFGFLTKRHFIVLFYDRGGHTAMGPSLKVYDFSQPVNTHPEPKLHRTFQLPLLSPDFDISRIIIRCCPFSETENICKNRPPGYPFYTAASSWIVGINLSVTDEFDRYYGLMLFFFPSTLLNGVYSSWQESVEWESWGPKGTRMLPLEASWIDYTYGTRFGTFSRREDCIYVYDFNPKILYPKLTADSSITDDVEKMLQELVGEEVRIFANPVKTSLPFNLQKTKTSERYGYSTLMIDENCLIGLVEDITTFNVEKREILYI